MSDWTKQAIAAASEAIEKNRHKMFGALLQRGPTTG